MKHWGKLKIEEGEKNLEERKKEKEKKQKQKKHDTSDDESEIVRWLDITEDCGLPHPDSGYDPWSY